MSTQNAARPETPPGLVALRLARELRKDGRADEAAWLYRSLEGRAEEPTARQELAQLMQGQGRHGAALALYDGLEQSGRLALRGQLGRLRALRQQHRYADAEVAAQRLLQAQPGRSRDPLRDRPPRPLLRELPTRLGKAGACGRPRPRPARGAGSPGRGTARPGPPARGRQPDRGAGGSRAAGRPAGASSRPNRPRRRATSTGRSGTGAGCWRSRATRCRRASRSAAS